MTTIVVDNDLSDDTTRHVYIQLLKMVLAIRMNTNLSVFSLELETSLSVRNVVYCSDWVVVV